MWNYLTCGEKGGVVKYKLNGKLLYEAEECQYWGSKITTDGRNEKLLIEFVKQNLPPVSRINYSEPVIFAK